MLAAFLLSSAALVITTRWRRPCSPAPSAPVRHVGLRAAADGAVELELLSAALPFLGEELLAEDVRYSGLGVTLQGRLCVATA